MVERKKGRRKSITSTFLEHPGIMLGSLYPYTHMVKMLV